MRYISYSTSTRSSPLQKVLAIIVTVVLVTLGIMFSAVLLSIVLFVVVIGGLVLLWKTRGIRKQMRQMQENMQATMQETRTHSANPAGGVFKDDVSEREVYEGIVIEGEATRVDEPDGNRK